MVRDRSRDLLDLLAWDGDSAPVSNPGASAGAAPDLGCLAASARCPVCDCPDVTRHRNGLSQCQRCWHIFQTDLRVSAVYDAAYARQYDQRPHEEMSTLRWRFIQRWLGLSVGSRVLDIGYGNGSLLKHARAQGMEVFGLDVHGEDFGIPTVDYYTPQTFDLICFFDSLEHFVSFDCLFRLQAAYAVVSLPAPPDYLLDTPERWRHYKPGEHLHHFCRDSLDFLMGKWGLRHKLADGFPEDELRGKLHAEGRTYDNIYTAIYGRGGHT